MSGKIFLKLYPGVGLVELSGASLQEEEEEVDLVGVIPMGGQVVLNAVSETSVLPLPTSLPSSDMLSDLVFTEPVNSFDESCVEVHPVPVSVSVSVEELGRGENSLQCTG